MSPLLSPLRSGKFSLSILHRGQQGEAKLFMQHPLNKGFTWGWSAPLPDISEESRCPRGSMGPEFSNLKPAGLEKEEVEMEKDLFTGDKAGAKTILCSAPQCTPSEHFQPDHRNFH